MLIKYCGTLNQDIHGRGVNWYKQFWIIAWQIKCKMPLLLIQQFYFYVFIPWMYQDIHVRILTGALFVAAKCWKQFQCSLLGELSI